MDFHTSIPNLPLFSSSGVFGNQRNEKEKGKKLYTKIQSPLHEVAQRRLLPRPAFSIQVVPLEELVHVC